MRIRYIILIFSTILIDSLKAEDVFPDVRGFRKEVSEKIYTSENLWDLINGAADSYLEYDFQKLTICEYTTNIDLSIKIELYEHKDGPSAFGIYSRERQPDYQYVPIGTEGYIAGGGILNFFTGRYYVKCKSRDIDAMQLLAVELIKNLGSENKLPAILELLPPNQIYRSEAYESKNFLGYSFLTEFYTAKYRPEIKFFISKKSSTIEAQKILQSYLEKTQTSYKNLKEGLYKISDPYSGKVYVYLSGNYLFGVQNFENKNDALTLLVDCKKKIDAEQKKE